MDQDENGQSHDQEHHPEITAELPRLSDPRLLSASRLLASPPSFRNQPEYWHSMGQDQWRSSPQLQQQQQQQQQHQQPLHFPPYSEPQPLAWQQPRWREQQMHTPLERSAGHAHVTQTHPDADHFRWDQANSQPGHSPHEPQQQQQASPFSRFYWPGPGDRHQHQHQHSRDHDLSYEHQYPPPNSHTYPHPHPHPHLVRSHPHPYQVSDVEATLAMPYYSASMDSQPGWSQASHSMARTAHSGSPSHPEPQILSVSEPGSPILSTQERPTLAPYRHRSKTISSATPTPYQLRHLELPSMTSSATATSNLPLDPSHHISTGLPGPFPVDADGVQQRKRGRTSSLRYRSIQRRRPHSSDEFQSAYSQEGHFGSRPQSLGTGSHEHSPNPGPLPSFQPTFASSAEESVANSQNKRPLNVSPPSAMKAKRLPESQVFETLRFDQQPNPSEFGHPLGTAERHSIVHEHQNIPTRTGSNTERRAGIHSASASRRTDVSLRQVAPIHEEVLKMTSRNQLSQHPQQGYLTPDPSHGDMLPPASRRPPTPQAPRQTKPDVGIMKGKSGGPSPDEIGRGRTTTRLIATPSPNSSTDASSTLAIQLGKLLIATKQHIMTLLLSFLSKEGPRIAHDRHPRLEHVLVDLINDMLMLHSASSARDHISSQERPATFQPTRVLSLLHLRELMGDTDPAMTNRASVDIKTQPSANNRLPEEDKSKHSMSFDGPRANEYGSTVEFLALMTAFVSVVCWLLRSRLDDKGEKGTDRMEASRKVERGIRRFEADGELLRFLSHFHDRDNVLKPIEDALATTKVRNKGRDPSSRNFDGDGSKSSSSSLPSQSLTGQGGGLFTWHFFLFSEDPESPSQLPSSRTALQDSCSLMEGEPMALDVILNELYSTQVLALTAKDHQKDHGQFYTPPAVVNFMWTRATSGREGRLLDRFVEHLYVHRDNLVETTVNSDQDIPISLIPKALDPCLGVSTFLSRYVRLLIKEAHHRKLFMPQSAASGETHEMDMDISGSVPVMLWDSAPALRLLLCQICEHAWGLELDDFAYWIARCGFMSNLIPLIQRIDYLSQDRTFGNLDTIAGAQKDITMESTKASSQLKPSPFHRTTSNLLNLPRLHLFCNDTLQLTIPEGGANQHDMGVDEDDMSWERAQIMKLRDPSELQFDFIVTNPPYMIRKTGTFSAPDPLIYDWRVLGTPGTLIGPGLDQAAAAAEPEMPVDATELIGFAQGDELDTGEPSEKLPRSRQLEQSRSTGSTKTTKSSGSSRGMMQAYGYFIWFAAQRIIPMDGVLCMITASQWLTLDFATQLRAWMIENCLMDELFQFEPFKVFAKVQTDSLIFKVRSLPLSTRPNRSDARDQETLFLRHLVRHRSLSGILKDYSDLLIRLGSPSPQDAETMDLESTIAFSRKGRQELQEAIMPPRSLSSDDAQGRRASPRMLPGSWNYSFAPMMPTSDLTEHMRQLTVGLGGICSAGTKKKNRVQALEPLLWHRGPNTNPVYGLVVRMEFAEASFGSIMTEQWFRPALYWNGKNSPQEGAEESAATIAKALHKEGQFWQNRDRLRLSRKEGSPAESYLVPSLYSSTGFNPSTSSGALQQRHRYALCMIDRGAVKSLKKQKESGVEGAQALWEYLVDVRAHFQPGLAASKVSKGKKSRGAGKGSGTAAQRTNPEKVVTDDGPEYIEMASDDVVDLQQILSSESSSKAAPEDEGVAFCSTNQCGADVPEKIVHPINYGYFSKSQPRQRFFLDRASLAVTNQCIYLTLNTFSIHQAALHLATSPQELMMYFLTLLNSSTLQFFVLHTCQYDQQGRMRLFRESMAKIPFQDRDLRTNNQHRMQYVVRLGQAMIDLKEVLYDAIKAWRIGENLGSGSSGLGAGPGAGASSAVGQALLDCVRRGGDIPAGVINQAREHLGRMLGRRPYSQLTTSSSSGPMDLTAGSELFTADTDTDTNSNMTDTDTETDDNSGVTQHVHPFESQDSWRGDPLNPQSTTQGHSHGRGSVESSTSQPHHYQHQHHHLIHSPTPIHPTLYSSTIQRQERVDIIGKDSERRLGTTLQRPTSTDTSHALVLPDQQAELPLATLLSALPNPSPSSSSGSRSRPSSADAICDRAIRGLERALMMVEVVQWAVDQYGYMLYGVSSSVQIQLEKELKLVYSSAVDELLPSRVVPDQNSETLPAAAASAAAAVELGPQRESGNRRSTLETLDILLAPLYRWDPDLVQPTTATDSGSGSGSGSVEGSSSAGPGSDLAPPTYASSILNNAQMAVQELRNLLDLNSL